MLRSAFILFAAERSGVRFTGGGVGVACSGGAVAEEVGLGVHGSLLKPEAQGLVPVVGKWMVLELDECGM